MPPRQILESRRKPTRQTIIALAGALWFSMLATLSALAQPLSPYLLGQNAWMPSWYGGSINQLWDEMQTAGFQTIRVGGNAAMNDNKDLAKVIQLIDGVRSAGAEPIVQVPHDYS